MRKGFPYPMRMKSGDPVLVLIAAPAGIMGSSLRTFLRTLPEVRVVAQVAGRQEALDALDVHPAHVLLCDVDLIDANHPPAGGAANQPPAGSHDEHGPGKQPLYSAAPAGGSWAGSWAADFLEQARQRCAGLRCIVLVNSPLQQAMVLAAGADHALLKGSLDEGLRQILMQCSSPLPPPNVL